MMEEKAQVTALTEQVGKLQAEAQETVAAATTQAAKLGNNAAEAIAEEDIERCRDAIEQQQQANSIKSKAIAEVQSYNHKLEEELAALEAEYAEQQGMSG